MKTKRVKAFMIRHQAAGILTDNVFAFPPTEEQLSEASDRCAKVHNGGINPNSKEPWWTRSHPTVLHLPEAIADGFEEADPEPAPAGEGEGGAPGEGRVALKGPTLSGTGIVRNPGE